MAAETCWDSFPPMAWVWAFYFEAFSWCLKHVRLCDAVGRVQNMRALLHQSAVLL